MAHLIDPFATFTRPNSYGLVLAAGGEGVALGVPGHVPHATNMFAQSLHQLQFTHFARLCCVFRRRQFIRD